MARKMGVRFSRFQRRIGKLSMVYRKARVLWSGHSQAFTENDVKYIYVFYKNTRFLVLPHETESDDAAPPARVSIIIILAF